MSLTTIQRIVLSAIVLGLLFNRSGWAAPPADPVVGSRIHIIYVADTEDTSIGPFIKRNTSMFEGLIDSQIRADRKGSVTYLYDDACTVERLRKAVSGLIIKPVDTVWVYYAGHGAFDPNFDPADQSQGHHLQLTDAKLYRKDLLAQIALKQPRLTVLLSDCCNVDASITVPEKLVFETKARTVTGWTGLEDLLLSYRGVVNATASSPGEYSWFSDDVGGWFTSQFLQCCYDLEPGQPVDWKSRWSALSQQTDQFFLFQKRKFAGGHPQLAQQEHMRPMSYQLDVERQEAQDKPTTPIQMTIPVWTAIPVEP